MELYTIIAQFINFGVLIFLLNKFLYKPVLKTMEKRREDIKNKIEETEKKLEESEKLKEEYFNKLQEVEKENIVLRKKAIADIKKFKEEELQKAKDDISAKKDKFNDYLDLEQKNLIENFNEDLSDLFVEYSNNILQVLANSTLQDEIVNSFVEKVNELTADKVDSVNKLNLDNIYIYSNAELNAKQKNFIKDSLIEKGFKFKDIQCDIDKDLILGIELKAKSYILSWNVKELTTNFISNIDNKINDKK